MYSDKTLRNFIITNDISDYLHQLERDNKLAIATSYERIRKYQSNSGAKLYCFNDMNNLYGYPLKILMQKNFPYADELNRFIMHASEGGLIYKWLKRRNRSEKPTKLHYFYFKLESLLFGGTIFLGTTALTFLILFVEMIVFKNVQKANPALIWLFMDMAIDPERHFLLEDLTY